MRFCYGNAARKNSRPATGLAGATTVTITKSASVGCGAVITLVGEAADQLVKSTDRW